MRTRWQNLQDIPFPSRCPCRRWSTKRNPRKSLMMLAHISKFQSLRFVFLKNRKFKIRDMVSAAESVRVGGRLSPRQRGSLRLYREFILKIEKKLTFMTLKNRRSGPASGPADQCSPMEDSELSALSDQCCLGSEPSAAPSAPVGTIFHFEKSETRNFENSGNPNFQNFEIFVLLSVLSSDISRGVTLHSALEKKWYSDALKSVAVDLSRM